MSVDTDNAAFQDALNLIQYTPTVGLSDRESGYGKIYISALCLRAYQKEICCTCSDRNCCNNAGGSTMHSFFKLPFYPLLPDDPNLSLQRGRIHEFFKYTKPHRKLLEQIELVIIDEISMVRADIIDAIDRILRVYSHNLREPFGGKTVTIGRRRFPIGTCREE